MENEKKGGMSKGCLVGLIIAGVLLVIVIVGIVLVVAYKDDLGKMGAVTVVNQAKQIVADNPIEGVDTAQFNAVADAFAEKMTEDSTVNLESLGLFMQKLQPLVADGEVSASDAEKIKEAVVDIYPDIADLLPTQEVEEPAAEVEEAVTEE